MNNVSIACEYLVNCFNIYSYIIIGGTNISEKVCILCFVYLIFVILKLMILFMLKI